MSGGPETPASLPTSSGVSSGIARLRAIHAGALADPESFWERAARELYFSDRHGAVFEPLDAPPYGRWFAGWKTNLAYNCLDRWLDGAHRHRLALQFDGEPGDRRSLTYLELHTEVNRLAAALRARGVRPGDRVTIYLPLIPEAVIAMLAVVRLGAVHSVVFAGFTAGALAGRVNDSGSKLLITADGGWRRGKVVELKRIADEALAQCPTIEHVVVVRRTGQPVGWTPGRDAWYHEVLPDGRPEVPAEMVAGTHPSFLLYTSGTTGRPKGAVHSTAGYMVWLHYTMQAVFGLTETDLFWCTADVGWVTGHSYVVYGPLLRGTSVQLYEGAPDHPTPDRWWQIIERNAVTILYTSPTAIRGFIRAGESWPQRHDLRSLRLLGSVGEPINPEAWHWYHRVIGREECPIIDSWWQTETGGILVSPQPGIAPIPLKPGSATLPIAGVDIAVVDDTGAELPAGTKGQVVIRRPWPGQFLTLWNDPERFVQGYFRKYPGWYHPADFGLRDADGYFWFLGRADEVMKVAGHRLSTTEIEHSIANHSAVAESAVIGRHDEVKGEVPVACVILRPGHTASPELRREIADQVRRDLGPIAVPGAIYFVAKVPKTRSAKIMRRLIRDVVEERPLGDTTTLEDETSLEEAQRAFAELQAELARDKTAPARREGPD